MTYNLNKEFYSIREAAKYAEEAKERAFNLTTYKAGDYTKLLRVI